jgi:multiple sugar transport system ATP-binding protein
MAEVVLKNIGKYFGKHKVIDHFDLHIKSGEFVTLLGPSGCGKTTLLRMIAGLEKVDEGEIFIGNKKYNFIPAQKRSIAMVFQSYALFPHINVRNNILFGLTIKKMGQKQMQEKLQWVLLLLGLQGLEKRLPKEISGGQRQRVALARALVLDPDVLLLDEPLSNLDTALRELAIEELKRIHHSVGKTIIYVTHNQAEAMTMSERIAVIKVGTLEQYDTPRTLYDHPNTVFCAEFIGSPATNILDGLLIRDKSGFVIMETEMGAVFLDAERVTLSEKFIDTRVILSIRPQDIHFANDTVSRRTSDTTIALSVELVETMGDRSLVVARTGANTVIRFISGRDEEIHPGDYINVVIDGRRIHVFDPQTKKNVFKKNNI